MPNINLNAATAARIAKELRESGECSVGDLVELTGIPRSTVVVIVKEMHDKKMIHICGWERSKQGSFLKIYEWGHGEDVKQPIKTFKPKKPDVFVDDRPWPRCDEAAAWMRNPI